MEILGSIWSWLQSNHSLLAEGILLVLMGLSMIAKLTPTKKDDEIIAKIDGAIRKLLGILGLQPSDKKKSS